MKGKMSTAVNNQCEWKKKQNKTEMRFKDMQPPVDVTNMIIRAHHFVSDVKKAKTFESVHLGLATMSFRKGTQTLRPKSR